MSFKCLVPIAKSTGLSQKKRYFFSLFKTSDFRLISVDLKGWMRPYSEFIGDLMSAEHFLGCSAGDENLADPITTSRNLSNLNNKT